MGDRHLTLELGDSIDLATNSLVYAAERILLAARPRGLRETTPAYASLLVRFSPLETTHAALAEVCLAAARAARAVAKAPCARGRQPTVDIPVVYGGEYGPDLEGVAERAGFDPEEVARRHAAATYRVYLVGFAPGFAYLGGLDPALATPRLEAPRPRVAAGSVGIAGNQTGVYPAELPGGWRIIGRTPAALWDPDREPPSLLRPGQAVRFIDAGRGPEAWARAKALLGDWATRDAGGDGGARGSQPGAGGANEPGAGGRDRATGAVLATVLKAGPLDTIQDGGRFGYSGVGLPESGALDYPGLAEANLAVENGPGEAGLEVTYGGLVVRFEVAARVAVSRGVSAWLDGAPLEAGTPYEVSRGAVLAFEVGRLPRGYLAVAGGLGGPAVLGSRSTYLPSRLGGVEGRPLRAGDVLRRGDRLGSGAPAPAPRVAAAAVSCAAETGLTVVRVVPGPQAELFGEGTLADFLDREWTVLPSSDRRACLLDGDPLPAPDAGGLSDGSPAGSIQVPPSGKPVALLADHQTTGGYPKIAVAIGPDLPLFGRAWPGSRVKFRMVSAEEAAAAWMAMDPVLARSWPGNDRPEAKPAEPGYPDRAGREEAERLFTLRVGGRSHLISVRPSPPRLL